MYGSLDTSTSALTAYRTQLDVIAGNIAMKDAVRYDENGEAFPFRRRVALLSAGDASRGDGTAGVQVSAIVEDPAPYTYRPDPTHPDAIKAGPNKGSVRVSNIDYHTEMVNAMMASRAYEANVTVMEMTKSMVSSSLRLLA